MLGTVRISLDIPDEFHRRIHEAAKRRGCSARALILSAVEREVAFDLGSRRRVKIPLVTRGGDPVNPTRDEIYDGLFS
jgi:hypothetical protein